MTGNKFKILRPDRFINDTRKPRNKKQQRKQVIFRKSLHNFKGILIVKTPGQAKLKGHILKRVMRNGVKITLAKS